MRLKRIQLICFLIILSASSIYGSDWYKYEFDGNCIPDEADPIWKSPWQKFQESYAVNGVYKMTVPKEKGGHIWIIQQPAWNGMNTDSTVEFRVFILSGEKSAITSRFLISNGSRNWILLLRNGDGKDFLENSTPGKKHNQLIEVPNDFFTVRICIKDNNAFVYINNQPEPVISNWKGYHTKKDNHLYFGNGTTNPDIEWGTTVWDYIRWTNNGAFLPAKQGKTK